ncbi:VOC family protein [Marinobacter sp.]|uniref:VOC family protein n=1 Tax=Marinobacter sp. TaxID=50741 RepID=UPI0034A1FF38
MAEISSLGYIGLGVSSLDEWQTFAADILGMQVGSRDGDVMKLRMDEYLQRFLLIENGRDDIMFAGWEFNSASELEDYVAEIRGKDVEVRELTDDERALRHVEKAYAVRDPNGYDHEFFFGHGVAQLADRFRSKVLKSGFVTGELGIGHILPFCKNREETLGFYENILKFRLSDYIREEVAPGMVVDASFFHTKTGRHHSIATAEVPDYPRTLNHFMLEVADIDDVGLAYDRVAKAGIPVALELGHHPNDKVFSFYAQTPSGFNFEIGWGAIVIDDNTWEVKSYSQMSDWGHKRH